jgi:uncharacterized membrane protein
VNVFRLSDRVWRGIGLATAAAVRLVALGRADLWTDEIQTLHAVRLDWGALVSERLGAGHVPLYFLLEKAWCSVFGESQFALRLPTALLGFAMLVPAWSLLRRLVGERGAWWGTALLAFHPLLVELSREARMYTLLAFLVLVAADRAVATLDGEKPGPTFWTAVALGPFVHATWAVAMAPLLAWLWIERRSATEDARRASRRALLGVAASLAVLLVALAFAHAQRQALTRRPWPREVGVFVFRVFAGSDLRPFHSWLAAASVVSIWATYVVLGWRDAPPRVRRFALAWGVGVPATSVAVGVVGGLPWGPARYVQVAAVGFAALFAVAAAVLGERQGHRSRAPVLLLVALLCCVVPIASPATHWSEVAASLAADPSPVVVDDESERIVLSHYLGRDVGVGSPPSGAASWRRVSFVAEGACRTVQVVTQTR